jgi:hypothetical protein
MRGRGVFPGTVILSAAKNLILTLRPFAALRVTVPGVILSAAKDSAWCHSERSEESRISE